MSLHNQIGVLKNAVILESEDYDIELVDEILNELTLYGTNEMIVDLS